MTGLRVDTAAYLRATDFVPEAASGADATWEIWGTGRWVTHRDLMVLTWTAGVLDLESNGHIRLFDTDAGPAVDLLQPINAPLDPGADVQPSGVAFDVRFGIVTKLKNSKRIGVQAAEAVGIASPELTVTEVARWGDIHARGELRNGHLLAPHRQLEKLGVVTRQEPERPGGLWGKVKATLTNDTGRPTVGEYVIDPAAIAGVAAQADSLAAQLRAWLQTPMGSAVNEACAAAFDSTSPRHGQDPRV